MTAHTRSSAARGIPTARHVDHFAFTVADLAEAVRFFTDVLGGELVYRLADVSSDDDWMSVHLNVHPRARCDIAMIRFGPTTNLELFEYTAPDQNLVAPRNNDVGGHHLAIQVDDVDAALDYLRVQPGVRVLGEPQNGLVGAAGCAGRWVYLLTPWGMHIAIHEASSVPGLADAAPAWHNGNPDAGTVPAIPGARSVGHVSYTVADLSAAVDFFVGVIGADLVHRTGPIDVDPGFLARQLNIDGAGSVERAMIRLGPADNLELLAYRVVGSSTVAPRNSDVGGHHLAYYVDDVDEAVDYLRGQPGVRILGTPETIVTGPISGDRWVYFDTPIGIQMEVLMMPDGKLPYERDTSARRCPGGEHVWTERP
jgi:2-epi-5-epi-valiolone epimerase